MESKKLVAPSFTLIDVRYAEDAATYARAQGLWKQGKVKSIKSFGDGYEATVVGTKPYHVALSARRVDEGHCTCYMGENDYLCKHMLALAIAVLDATGGLERTDGPTDLAEVKRRVSAGVLKLRAYSGPSRTWFTYQRTLSTGVGMITEAVENLPPTRENAEYLWGLVLRLCKKLATTGIDDSDGVVGGCVGDIIAQLANYAKKEPALKAVMLPFCKDDTGFGFEDELRAALQKR